MITLALDWEKEEFDFKDVNFTSNAICYNFFFKERDGLQWPILEVTFTSLQKCFNFLNSFYGVKNLDEMEEVIELYRI